MLADDADPESVQRPFVREAAVRLRRQPSDAEGSQLIPWIVARDDLQHARAIFYGAAQRSHPRIQGRADHSVAADQLLRRRESNDAVVLGGVMDGPPGFLSDRARHQVRGYGRSGAAAGGAGTAFGIVGVTKGPAEGAARVRRSHFSQIRLGEDDRPRVSEAPDEGCIARRAIVRIRRIHARRRAHVEGVVLVFDG